MNSCNSDKIDLEALLKEAVAHLDHVLPGQGPILDFIHHNTIHGFQNKPFFTALEEYEELTGISGFQNEAVNRRHYREGRITDADIAAVMAGDSALEADSIVCVIAGRALARGEILKVALVHELPALSPAQLRWQLQTHGPALQADVGAQARAALQAGGQNIDAALAGLWQALCGKFGVPAEFPHAEDYAVDTVAALPRSGMLEEVEEVLNRIGRDWTMRTFLLRLTGVDILDTVRPTLIRLGGSLLDEGLASWHLTDHEEPGLYRAWRRLAAHDLWPALLELDGAERLFESLPDNAWAALEMLLRESGIPPTRWGSYLERLALELPGWAGLINWRQHHPRYHTVNHAAPALEDFLAIRLCLDKLVCDRLCHELWRCKSDYPSLMSHFRINPAELRVRCDMQEGQLPEYLLREAEALVVQVDADMPGHEGWDMLAARIAHWEHASANAGTAGLVANGQLWQLFCLCQYLGLTADHVEQAGKTDLRSMLETLEGFTPAQRGRLWLFAFERNYRDAVLNGLAANHERGGWFQRVQRPEAQIVLCMDEREESFRRNLEELNPGIETLGAAGFFGIPMQYTGLDAVHATPLCPVVVTPAHEVREVPRAGQEAALVTHRKGWRVLQRVIGLVHQRMRIDPLLAFIVMLAGAPFVLASLLLQSLVPGLHHAIGNMLKRMLVPEVGTELTLTNSTEQAAPAGTLQPGFTFKEQSERVAGMLRTLGLTRSFAPIVVFSGHGSTSQNNPHEAAHDCGACGGRQGGPNARAFAAMANRAEVRALLAENMDIHIPADTWFVGTQHDTCNDAITWFDTDLVPAVLKERFDAFRATIVRAQGLSAQERARRFATARWPKTPADAFRHVTLRAQDGSQVRPEYGHATNAAAVIGRRQLTQGLFLDRRVFLISYDPTQDESGAIIQNILLTAGPVGAGINLEYYFSTIDNERFGCGTKIPHNVTGLFGVMEGAQSDLRTGLPLQMVEIHEAMRLQVIVEASVETLTRIYLAQPPLQELVGGGWLLLTSVDPHTGAIHIFESDKGFVPWQAARTELPVREKSTQCYARQTRPVPPMLIRQPLPAGA